MVTAMSELQAALLTIGSGVIVAVYGYGWWQQRKYRKKFGTAFDAEHDDALYQAPKKRIAEQDEAISIRNAPQPYPASDKDGGLDDKGRDFEVQPVHFIDDTVEIPDEELPVTTLPDVSCELQDQRSDFLIELHLIEPSLAHVLDGLWQRKFDFGKPVQVLGLTLTEPHWERVIAESHTLYSHFRIALQLVDRGGAISAAKLSDFRDLVLGIARHIRASADIPNFHEMHHRAVELDAFCAEVDQMVGINLVPPGERLLSGIRIAHAAAMHGMALEADGAFHLKDASGHGALCLINQNSMPFQHLNLDTFTTPGITLLLDVPRVEHPALQFDRMVSIAHELSRELQVNMVDDNRVVLSEAGLERIRKQVAAVEAKMCAAGISPGSAQARRLFA